jgi:hypothetical protein
VFRLGRFLCGTWALHFGGRFNPALLRYIGEFLLGLFLFGLCLEMLAVARAKAHELRVRSRGRALVYYGLAISVVAVFFLWLLLGSHGRWHR